MSLITFENISFNAKLDVTRQAKYAQHNTEERCRRKAISTACSEFVFVDLGIQNTIRMQHSVICGLSPLYNIFFFYIISGRHDFRKKVIQLFLYNFCLKLREIWSKCIFRFTSSRHSCQILMKPEFSRHILKNSNTKFHENPSSRSPVVPRGRTVGHTWQSTQFLFVILGKRLKISPPDYPFLVRQKRKPLSFVEPATYSRIKEHLEELQNVSRRINNICHLWVISCEWR